MIKRALEAMVDSSKWGRQMRFIAGPRQSGKTTLAKSILQTQGDNSLYFNWDAREIKIRHSRKEDLIKTAAGTSASKSGKRWACFDEIHKMPKWKNILKSYFDIYEEKIQLLVTGSARLDLFRKSGDSLAGRYFLFHLLPVSLFELSRPRQEELQFAPSAEQFVESRISHTKKNHQALMETLLAHSGFPEPLLKADDAFLRIWKRDYLDRIVREDLRDLTRIAELENVAGVVAVLPSRIGSPLSVNSLREDFNVSHETIQNYLHALKLCYVVFEISAYAKTISRALKKEKKVYFFDWTRVEEEAARFENYVATELYQWVTWWQDSGAGEFQLFYVKVRSGQECDFMITKDKKPWLMIEAKLKDQPIASHLYHFSEKLGGIPIVQLAKQAGVLFAGHSKDYRISASRFLSA